MPATNLTQRLAELQAQIAPDTAWMLCKPEDVHYYTGFDCLLPTEREAFVVVTSQTTTLIHAAFSPIRGVPDFITKLPGTFASHLPQHLKTIHERTPFSTVKVDFEHISHSEFSRMQKNSPYTFSELNTDKIADQRMRKDGHELECIQKAREITTQLLEWIPSQFVEGVTEREVARRLYEKMIALGADSTPAFPFIVAFGAHSALPHHQPTEQTLKANTPVLIDIGARYQRYCSDMTRTFWFGDTPNPEFTEVETIVHAAYAAAEKVAQTVANGSSVTARDIDTAARSVIAAAGFGEYFTHTTGHGLGLEIHEGPSLSWRNENTVHPTMSITIEPGIYLPEKFGYRYENTVLL